MPFKFNIGAKNGKTFKLEADAEALIGKKMGEKVKGEDISNDLEGYELEIMGTSDLAGFPGIKNIEGSQLRKALLVYGPGMKKKCRKEGKKKRGNLKPKGLRLKRSIRGNEISRDSVQINLKVAKQGNRKLEEIFPDQNKKKEEKSGQTGQGSIQVQEQPVQASQPAQPAK